MSTLKKWLLWVVSPSPFSELLGSSEHDDLFTAISQDVTYSSCSGNPLGGTILVPPAPERAAKAPATSGNVYFHLPVHPFRLPRVSDLITEEAYESRFLLRSFQAAEYLTFEFSCRKLGT